MTISYHLEVGAPVSLKLATNAFFGGKKTLKIYIFRLLFYSKTEQCDSKKLSLTDKFTMLMCLHKYFLEVCSHALLKVATKGSFRGKKSECLAILGHFSEAKSKEYYQKKWSSCNRFGIIIPCLAKYFLDVGALVSLKVTTKTYFRDKKYFENLDF